MKKLLIFSLLAIGLGLGLTSCLTDTENEVSLLEEEVQEETVNRGPVLIISGRIHRKKTGCDCDSCFGLCGVSIGIGWSNHRVIQIIGDENEDGSAYLYLMEPVDYAEDLFYIDEDLEGLVQYGDEMEDRVLKAGRYRFEYVGDYEDEDPENPSYGRVKIRVQ